MIRALIKKDARLLRLYLRSAFVATVGCYLLMAILAVIFTNFQDERAQSLANLAMLSFSGGSNGGFPTTYFFAALLAGSVFTLERSDRSAEFLACLPPTRMQNLVSKLTVVLGATAMMVTVHLLSFWISYLLLPYIREQSGILTENRLPSALTVLTFVTVIVSVIGGALAVSAWLNSNGVPILCGLLTPVFVLSFVSLIGWALDIPSEGDAFGVRYAISSLVLGITFGYMGCHWYLTRSEP
jgi:ABC-type transport system involved in multi-copper enzyme maturation permease subunit